jgi:hypothetical protein
MNATESTRRDLVKGAGIAAIGWTIVKPGSVYGTPANSKLKVGLLGTGRRGSRISQYFVENPNSEVTALADIYDDHIARAQETIPAKEAQVYKSAKAILDADIDAIYIATPPYLHPEHFEMAVASGKHISSRVTASLGAGDRTKLNEYLESVREVERRIQNSESQPLDVELPDRPTDIPKAFAEHTRLMFDLQVLAFRADITRVFSMIMSRELSSMTFAAIGVPEQHHAVSHHRNDPELIAKKARIDIHQAQQMAYFLERLQATPDGDGSLLDHALVLYGGGMGDGNLHRHADLPTLMAGKLGGAFKTGRHLNYTLDTPMANLLLTMLDKVNVPLEKLGDSTGRLPLEPLSIA